MINMIKDNLLIRITISYELCLYNLIMNHKINSLPLGFAQQILDLQIKLEEEESLEVIQILSQMYRIAVDYYIDADTKKAMYFQKKLNTILVNLLNASSTDLPNKNNLLPNKIKKEISNYQQCEKSYVKTIVDNNQKAEKRFHKHVQADLNKQEEAFQKKMMRRVKSQGKIK